VTAGFIVTVAAAVTGIVAAVFALYLLILAVASALYRPPTLPCPRGKSRDPDDIGSPASGGEKSGIPRLIVLVPAHNEAELIDRCVASLRAQAYPSDRCRIAVIADNCTDETAGLARAAGAEVMIRDVPAIRGKGHALRWAMDRVLTAAQPPDAVVVVDADSIVDPDFLRELAGAFRAGHEVVQANDLLLVDSRVGRAALDAAALQLRNGVRLSGRAALGLPAILCGNGMLLSCGVLRRYPWSAFTATEDGEYSLSLRAAGVRVGFAPRARIYAQPTSNEAGATTQGMRWDAGRFYLMRRWLPRTVAAIVVDRRWDLTGEVIDLAMPPFLMLLLATFTGFTASLVLTITHTILPIALIPWALAVVVLPAYVVIGLRAARAPASFYASLLLLGPLFVARKLRIYRRLLRGYQMTQWVRTARPAESERRLTN
jgi:cellulose synthase/poly-beta-1,6-N-acetylglucosamine synthase-like glycosyltransferase